MDGDNCLGMFSLKGRKKNFSRKYTSEKTFKLVGLRTINLLGSAGGDDTYYSCVSKYVERENRVFQLCIITRMRNRTYF